MSDLNSLTQHEWFDLSNSCRLEFCHELVNQATVPINFLDTYLHHYSGESYPVALFKIFNEEFVLIPGGSCQLGFDVTCYTPSEAQIESYLKEEWVHESNWTLDKCLSSCLTKKRSVNIPSFLIGRSRRTVSIQYIDVSDPLVTDGIQAFKNEPQLGGWETNTEEHTLKIKKLSNGKFICTKCKYQSLETVTKTLAENELRLPTDDEWEYACGAGTNCLFAWGNYFPGEEGYTRIDHSVPKKFGLIIGDNSRETELVTGNCFFRGGDGGATDCYGSYEFFGALPHSQSFIMPGKNFFETSEATRFSFIRPVYDF